MHRIVNLLGIALVIVLVIAGGATGAAARQSDDAEEEAEAFIAYVVDIVTRIDATKSDSYASQHRDWVSPELVLLTETTETPCGTLESGVWDSFYCVDDATVYLDLIALLETAATFGIGAVEFAVATAWNWHVQVWERYIWDEDEYTWRADCMGARWVSYQVNLGALEPSAIDEARDYLWDLSGDELRLDYFDQGLDTNEGCWSVGPA
jgi:hypothetical protein